MSRSDGVTRRRGVALGVSIVALALAARAAAQPPPAPPKPGALEESRRKLLEQMGLKKEARPPAPPPAPPTDEPAPPAGEAAAPPAGPPSEAAPAGGPATPAPPTVVPFAGRVHEGLLASCRACHAAGAMAAATRLVLTGDPARDHAAARALVDLARPRRSLLVTKAAGEQHGGGPTVAAGSDLHRRLLQWISTGAELTARAPSGGAPALAAPVPPSRRPRPARAGAAAAPAAGLAGTPALPAPGVNTPELPATDPAAAGDPPSTPASAAPGPAAAPPPMPPEALALHPALTTGCMTCHREGGPAGMTRYRLSGQLEPDLQASRAFVDLAAPATSALVTKAAGQAHGGGAPWPADSQGHKLVLAWIAAGAPTAPPAPVVAGPETAGAAAPAPTGGAPPLTAGHPPPGAATALPSGHPPIRPLPLLGDELTLHGRFDLNLERRGFEGNPWAEGSQSAFQSYHHFVFLGRQSTEDPFVFTAEVTSLEFFELGVRLGPRRRAWHVHLRAGKLLVPFGNEPLFHQSYGGHVGFDQRVLPPIWAAEGVAASGSATVAQVTLSADLYGVKGHALRRADGVLSLQSDFSSADEARAAVGTRLGAAFGPLTAFYSAYFNPLGFDRRLFMQALDVSVWRCRRLPILDRLVLGAGVLRADVSGGGAGADYYHFASYWLARVYVLDWLHVQYRQGLRTFDNKRNLTYDERRASSADGSTHNIALVARHHGLSVGLGYYLNLEKADEVDDDLLRLSVAYEF